MTSPLKCKRIPLDSVPWEYLDRLPDRMICQTRAWIEFIADDQHIRPIILAVEKGSETVAYFSSLLLRRAGLKILGSPFPGWTTDYMGCNLVGDVSRWAVIDAVRRFAFDRLGCVHFEAADRFLQSEEIHTEKNLLVRTVRSLEIDLSRSEQDILKGMDKDYRRLIRRATERGVVVEEASDRGFAKDYYEQLEEVFAKHGMVPPYPLSRVEKLIEHVHPTGNLLLLRARSPQGDCIATGLWPAFNKHTMGWGSASHRTHLKLGPNQFLEWYAIRYWKARGMLYHDLGGCSDYKYQYGPYDIAVPRVVCSKYTILSNMRDLAKDGIEFMQRTRGLARRWITNTRNADLWSRLRLSLQSRTVSSDPTRFPIPYKVDEPSSRKP